MLKNREIIVQELQAVDHEFRDWLVEHAQLHREAEYLDNKMMLIPSEKERLRVLKRQKLLLKDKIERRIARQSGISS